MCTRLIVPGWSIVDEGVSGGDVVHLCIHSFMHWIDTIVFLFGIFSCGEDEGRKIFITLIKQVFFGYAYT